MERPLPPCQAACPVHTDTRKYAQLIAWGRFEEALEVVRKVNPLPSVCGRICQHPCEEKCRRGGLDAAVALKELKRFVSETVAASSPAVPQAETRAPDLAAATQGKVAVIGAGPAGLTAAQDLRGMGYAVTVFERLPQAGGMLNLIPNYRLPERVLKKDIEAILAHGIELRCNCEIGRDMQLADLSAEGYRAVIVCAGLSRSRGLALPGFGAERFVAAIPLMMDVWAGKEVQVGQRALVIGGGNVAVDVARTLRRLGAEEVAMACVESSAEIPATEEEIAAASEEGIRVMPSWGPKRVLKRDGRVAGLEMMRVTSVFDANGRFNPQYDFTHLKVVTADMIVLTIGQAGDTSWTRGSGAALDRRGRVVADRNLHTTSERGVFLAGEVLHGPGNAVEAIADGHRVAAIVDQFVRTGQVKALPSATQPVVADFPESVRENLCRLDRVPMPQTPVATRLKGFDEHDLGYDEAAALREAARCLNCGAGPVIDEDKCAFCLTCFRLCPLNGIGIGKKMTTSPESCQACGLCAAECPQAAIVLDHWPNEQLRDQIVQAIEEARPAEVSAAVVRCVHTAGTRKELAPAVELGDGATIHLNIPCLTHLTPLDIMLLVGNGIERIRIAICGPETCKHASSQRRARQVLSAAAQRAREIRPSVQIEFAEIHQPALETPATQGVDQ